MPNYDIYLLWGKESNGNILRYYGSTSNFIKRKYNHKKSYEHWVRVGRPNNKKCSSFCILDNGDWKMEKIDEVIGERWEAKKKEGEYQKNNDCVNIRLENRTRKEWKKQYYNNNKDIIIENSKEWYEKNKQARLEKNKQKITCECGSELNRAYLSIHRKTKKHINKIQGSK